MTSCALRESIRKADAPISVAKPMVVGFFILADDLGGLQGLRMACCGTTLRLGTIPLLNRRIANDQRVTLLQPLFPSLQLEKATIHYRIEGESIYEKRLLYSL